MWQATGMAGKAGWVKGRVGWGGGKGRSQPNGGRHLG